ACATSCIALEIKTTSFIVIGDSLHKTFEIAIFRFEVKSAGQFVYFSSLDKHLYSVNLDTGKLNWKFAASGRFFANPVIIDDKIYIGATDGRMYEIDAETGKLLDFFQATERITNQIAYNPQTQIIFLPTYANEIYCLKKKN
ncbi:MAG: PQQ-binding-like beta-propeller repeat protein, partial [Patescibacteria group bacterium]